MSLNFMTVSRQAATLQAVGHLDFRQIYSPQRTAMQDTTTSLCPCCGHLRFYACRVLINTCQRENNHWSVSTCTTGYRLVHSCGPVCPPKKMCMFLHPALCGRNGRPERASSRHHSVPQHTASPVLQLTTAHKLRTSGDLK